MKKVVLVSVILMLGCMVRAQVSHPRDTINGREVTYFYQDWFDSADCVPAITGSGVLCNKVSGYHLLLPMETAKYNYTETPLKIIGIAAAVLTSEPPQVGIIVSDEGVGHIIRIDDTSWSEYLRLYQPTDSGLTVVEEKLISVQDTARCMKVFYNAKVGNHWDTLIHSTIVPVYEVFFDKPVTVTDSFYVGMTANSSIYNAQTHSYPGMTAEIVMLVSYGHLSVRCFPQKTASYIGAMGYFGWDQVLSNFATGWHYGEGDAIRYIFPIIDTTGSYRVPDSCKTVRGLEMPYQDSNYAYLTWERGRFNQTWEVAYGPADEDVDGYVVDTCSEEHYMLRGLTPGVEYAARVRGTCFEGEAYSEWSDTVRFVRMGTQDVAEPSPHTYVSPNPARGEVTVASDVALRNITVYDMQGHRVLEHGKAEGFTASLDVSALPQGSYVIVVHTAQGRSTQKLLIER